MSAYFVLIMLFSSDFAVVYRGFDERVRGGSRDYMFGIFENYHCWRFHALAECRASKL